MNKLKTWWLAAPEWQRRAAVGGTAALVSFVLGALIF
jgi:hypothetical protein